MKAQITLTVNQSKRIIAKGLARHRAVRKAMRSGRIFLKGGTTVSAVAEELVGSPLRISGRVTLKGTKTGADAGGGFHCALIENHKLVNVEDSLIEVVGGLRAGDVGIVGANAIDAYGNAALMYGAPLGGGPGVIISGLMAEIPNIFIAVGLEKLVPGSLAEIIPRVARKGVDLAMGMAVGLTPVSGNIISEDRAIELLGKVRCTVIARGGVYGAEGATTMLVEGAKDQVQAVFDTALALKDAKTSGTQRSQEECSFPTDKCKNHQACMYKRKKSRK